MDIFTTSAMHIAHIHKAIRSYNSVYLQAPHVKSEDKSASMAMPSNGIDLRDLITTTKKPSYSLKSSMSCTGKTTKSGAKHTKSISAAFKAWAKTEPIYHTSPPLKTSTVRKYSG